MNKKEIIVFQHIRPNEYRLRLVGSTKPTLYKLKTLNLNILYHGESFEWKKLI